MSGDLPRIRRGAIFWLPNTLDENGVNSETRAFVVYSEEADINDSGLVYAVAVSTHPRMPREPQFEVLLPSNQGRRRSTTSFTRDCWAICRWLRVFKRESLPAQDGYVGGQVMERVKQAIEAAEATGHQAQP